MTTIRLPNSALLAALIMLGGTGFALAQTSGTDPHHPADASQAAEPSAEGMTGSGMMQGGMMERGMMGGTPMMGMRGHMMKIMFAIADTDGDDALSFEEVTTVHKRIFDAVDANKDGKVTPDEMQAFMRQ